MGQLVRHSKVGQVNWQKSGGGPEFAVVKRAWCQALHMKRVAASCEVLFEAPAFAAWVKNNKKEVLKESSRRYDYCDSLHCLIAWNSSQVRHADTRRGWMSAKPGNQCQKTRSGS